MAAFALKVFPTCLPHKNSCLVAVGTLSNSGLNIGRFSLIFMGRPWKASVRGSKSTIFNPFTRSTSFLCKSLFAPCSVLLLMSCEGVLPQAPKDCKSIHRGVNCSAMQKTGTIKMKGKELLSVGRFQPKNNLYFLKKQGLKDKKAKQT